MKVLILFCALLAILLAGCVVPGPQNQSSAGTVPDANALVDQNQPAEPNPLAGQNAAPAPDENQVQSDQNVVVDGNQSPDQNTASDSNKAVQPSSGPKVLLQQGSTTRSFYAGGYIEGTGVSVFAGRKMRVVVEGIFSKSASQFEVEMALKDENGDVERSSTFQATDKVQFDLNGDVMDPLQGTQIMVKGFYAQ